MDKMLQTLGLKEGEAIVHPWINKALEKAQQKVEARNFDIRKNLLKFDDVMNDQRKVIFDHRISIMRGEDVSETIDDMRHHVVDDLVSRHIPENAYAEQWDAVGLRDKLREVLVNLLHNAVEYNHPNGSIELSLERTNAHVRIEVRDTGIGISPDAIEHIFERFYRADPSRHADTPHAGLGLAIVKSYMDLMGGTIRVSSSTAGTVFTLELPMIESASAPNTAIQPTPAMAPH